MTFSPRVRLLGLIGLFFLPIAASLFAYYVIRPGANANYGELIAPRPAHLERLAVVSARPHDAAALREKWVMVVADGSACAGACVDKLTLMRQVRLALGRNASRVARLMVVDGGSPAAELVGDGVVVARDPGPTAAPALGPDRDHIYLVDPRGDVMLRWPAGADRKRMLRDLERLLRASQIG